nr:prefoldin subunit 6 [Ipomoea batatas]
MASALRDLQRDLESKANDLSQLQKGNLLHPFLPELDLLNEEANVYKLIGPVLVKQDLAEARANVKKRIDYISAELYVTEYFFCLVIVSFKCVRKRLDATLQDLEEKQNSKKETVTFAFMFHAIAFCRSINYNNEFNPPRQEKAKHNIPASLKIM